jgi:hypothetical protein
MLLSYHSLWNISEKVCSSCQYTFFFNHSSWFYILYMFIYCYSHKSCTNISKVSWTVLFLDSLLYTVLTHHTIYTLNVYTESYWCSDCSLLTCDAMYCIFVWRHMVNECTASCILNLSTRWRWKVSFTLWPLYPLNRKLGRPQNRFGYFAREKNFLSTPHIKPWSFGCLAGSLVTVINWATLAACS